MAVTELASLNNSVAPSAEFTPTDDFYVSVDNGQIALEAKFPGQANFYLVSSAGINTISPLIQAAKTVVKVTPYMAGMVYRLTPQSRRATARAFKE